MKKSKVTGMIGTAVLHGLALLLLFSLTLVKPEPQEEGGVPVMLGETALAAGNADPYELTEVDVMPQPEPEIPQSEAEDALITQTDEPSVQVKREERKKDEPEEKKPEQPAVKEKTEAEKREEVEHAAAQAAASKIAGAFGKGSQMGSKGTAAAGAGVQGSADGNSGAGKTSGIGGYGTFDLNGRSLGEGGLPVPVYNVQDEGRVVVTIVVNPAGRVIGTSINKRTNTVNPALRRAAEEAARKARFNAVDGVDNQSGTITYYFKLK